MDEIQRMAYRVQRVMILGDDANPKSEWVGEWQTTPPTEPGSYWVIVGGVIYENTVRVEILPEGDAWIKWTGDGFDYPFFCVDVTHWLGPLPAPEKPK